jgi:hypothetical protein
MMSLNVAPRLLVKRRCKTNDGESAKTLGGIKFSVWSPTEVRKFSVAEITAPETYDEDGNASTRWLDG